MAKFTKLNIGDSVASSGGRVWKKLSAESAEEEITLEGTWVFNSVVNPPDFNDNTLPDKKYMVYSYNSRSSAVARLSNSSGYTRDINLTRQNDGRYYGIYFNGASSSVSLYIAYIDGTSNDWSRLNLSALAGMSLEIFEDISEPDVIVADDFLTWLKNNATKIA